MAGYAKDAHSFEEEEEKNGTRNRDNERGKSGATELAYANLHVTFTVVVVVVVVPSTITLLQHPFGLQNNAALYTVARIQEASVAEAATTELIFFSFSSGPSDE